MKTYKTGTHLAATLYLVLWVVSSAPAFAENAYTEAQLKLAGQIGAVLSLVERCGRVPRPSAAILKAMKAEGLKESDMTSNTAFKARVVKQAQALTASDTLIARGGASESERRNTACVHLVEMYGSSGYVRAGLAAPR